MASTDSPTLVIAGGGTGGHLFPGVAVAEAVEAADPSVEVAFVGTERGIEARVIPDLGYRLELVEVPMLKGGGVAGWARGLSRLPRSALGATGVLRRLRPSLVVSVGGYAAGPVTMLAAVRGVPTALMEQNSVPGMTNRWLGRVVDRAFLTFEASASFFESTECVVTGNPVRRPLLELAEAFDYAPPEPDGPFRVLIIGGSGGAGSFNTRLPTSFEGLGMLGSRLEVRHQAGRGRVAEVGDGYRHFAGRVEVVEFIDDMAEAYRWADLLICRAGASTIAEALVLGIPAIYVPFPAAADDHQTTNAQAVAEAGAGVLIGDDEIDQPRMARLLAGFIQNPVALGNLGDQARRLARPHAGHDIAQACLAMMKDR